MSTDVGDQRYQPGCERVAPGSGPGGSAGFSAPWPRQGGIRREKAASDRLPRDSRGRAHLGVIENLSRQGGSLGSGSYGIPQQTALTGGGDGISYERRNLRHS